MNEKLAVYNYAIIRVVPHVFRGEFVNVGVVLHSRTVEFLAMRAIRDAGQLGALLRGVDLELLDRYLECYDGICRGDPSAGPVAQLPTSERFHWLSSPRSDLLQSSPVHEGLASDPARALDELFQELVQRIGGP